MLNAVKSYLKAGLSVIPTDPIHKNPKVGSWTVFQKEQATTTQVCNWFKNGAHSPAIITGKVSGNIELLDFDEHARQFDVWKELVDEQCPELVESLTQQTTQNGGIHIVYRCVDTVIPGAKKLSMGAILVDGPGEHQHENKGYKAISFRGKWVITPTLIETRGEGGYFLAAPGKGYQLVNGSFCDILNVTTDERKVMLECAEILSEYVKEQQVVRNHQPMACGERPGDAYNSNNTIQSLLRNDGWKTFGKTKPMPDGALAELWTRPGKQVGNSATVYDNKVHVFSSNITPLEPRVTYDPFSYLTCTQYAGDFKTAASELSKQGYGKQNVSADVSGCHSSENPVSKSHFEGDSVSVCHSPVTPLSLLAKTEAPLSILIKEYVEQYSGTFYVHELDREFTIQTRDEKNNRSQILRRLAKEYKIKKVQGKVGCWKTVDGAAKPMKLGTKKTPCLEVTLPLGLSDLAQILPGNIILVAGAPNAGKTAFLLTALYTLLKNNKKLTTNGNCQSPSEKGMTVQKLVANGVRYLNSEMDETELTDRCACYPGGLELFGEGCEFVERYRDFADVVVPNGINFIDFLEIHEDFFELGKLIAEIFENLTTGICFIAVQKKQDADYAKGGSASLEKPRLVINLDRNEGHGKKCKIIKCKKTTKAGENHDGKEVDFDIDKNSNFVRYSTWRYVNEKQRKMYNNDYEKHGLNVIPEKEYAYIFRLTTGKQGRVLEHQVERWEKNYPGFNVRKELDRYEEDSAQKPFMGDGWFYQIPNMLAVAQRNI